MFNTTMRKDQPPAPESGNLLSVQSAYGFPNVMQGIAPGWWPDNKNSEGTNELPEIDGPEIDAVEDGKAKNIDWMKWGLIAGAVIVFAMAAKKRGLL